MERVDGWIGMPLIFLSNSQLFCSFFAAKSLSMTANTISMPVKTSEEVTKGPSSRDMLDRARWLLGIHKSLKQLYPKNEGIRHTWVCRRN